jgi:hypothetical protein
MVVLSKIKVLWDTTLYHGLIWFLVVQRIMMPSLSSIKQFKEIILALLYLEDGGTAIL